MFVLKLNPMQGRCEAMRIVGWSDDREVLVRFLEAERVEPYRDGQWLKQFRKNGPLEWFNPGGDGDIENVGEFEDWIADAKAKWRRFREFEQEITEPAHA